MSLHWCLSFDPYSLLRSSWIAVQARVPNAQLGSKSEEAVWVCPKKGAWHTGIAGLPWITCKSEGLGIFSVIQLSHV